MVLRQLRIHRRSDARSHHPLDPGRRRWPGEPANHVPTLQLPEGGSGLMPLPWVRLDTAFPMNQKLNAMLRCKDGHRAAFVYLCGLSVSGGQGSDGFISRSEERRVGKE